jgi:hypothetical protein
LRLDCQVDCGLQTLQTQVFHELSHLHNSEKVKLEEDTVSGGPWNPRVKILSSSILIRLEKGQKM